MGSNSSSGRAELDDGSGMEWVRRRREERERLRREEEETASGNETSHVKSQSQPIIPTLRYMSRNIPAPPTGPMAIQARRGEQGEKRAWTCLATACKGLARMMRRMRTLWLIRTMTMRKRMLRGLFLLSGPVWRSRADACRTTSSAAGSRGDLEAQGD